MTAPKSNYGGASMNIIYKRAIYFSLYNKCKYRYKDDTNYKHPVLINVGNFYQK